MKNVQVLGINITVCLILSLYLLYLTYLDYTNRSTKLPSIIRTLMDSFIIRLAIMVLIAATALGYNNLGGLHVAVLMAAAYLLTMSMVHKDQITENFIEGLTNQDEKEQMENKEDETDNNEKSYTVGEADEVKAICKNYEKNCDENNRDDKIIEACKKVNINVKNKTDLDNFNAGMAYMSSTADIGTKCKNGSSAKPSEEERETELNKSTLDNDLKDSEAVSKIVDKCNTAYANPYDNRDFIAACDTLDKTMTEINLNEPNIHKSSKSDNKEEFGNSQTNDNPIGKAFRETMGGEAKCGPYTALDSAFNPQPFRPADSVLGSGAPDQLPPSGANFLSTPSGPYATSGVARQMNQN